MTYTMKTEGHTELDLMAFYTSFYGKIYKNIIKKLEGKKTIQLYIKIINIYNYLAYSIALDSLITITFICPG